MFNMLYGKTARAPFRQRLLTLALFATLSLAGLAASAPVAMAQGAGSPDLVISQVYTRGGEPGATFRNDYVEIFNRSNVTLNLSDYTLQVLADAPPAPGFPGGLTTVSFRFVSSGGFVGINAGQYRLFQLGSSGNNGAVLPVTPDSGTTSPNFNIPGTTGRIALVKGFTTLVQFGCPVGVDASVADFFSYGAATCVEGSANFPAPTVTTAAVRNAEGCTDTDDNVADFTNAAPAPRNSATTAHLCNLPAPTSSLQFETSTATVGEGDGSAEIFVTRAGAVSSPVDVQYATSNNTATDRSDYTTALGTLRFAAGETRKSFRVLITDDVRSESSNESLTLTLGYPTSGVALDTRHIMKLSINDNDTTTAPNPIDTTDFFVRQHYADFLSRIADAPGLAFWTGQIEDCGSDAQCREVKRINVSAAFFLSIEFQETGFFAYRAYKAAFPESASRLRGFPLYRELWRDSQEIGRDVVVGQPGAAQQLEANKQTYVAQFVTRPEFLIHYPASQTPAQFVDSLNANAGGLLSQSERDQLVAELTAAGNTPAGRAGVLKKVVENSAFAQAETNRAFVLLQYFGYLRRNPNDAPEPGLNFVGYDFWLGKLNEHNGNFVAAEMVKSFIVSDEYRKRFAP
jgi:hypothetical protein